MSRLTVTERAAGSARNRAPGGLVAGLTSALLLCGPALQASAQDCDAHCDFMLQRIMIAGETCAVGGFDPSQTVAYSRLTTGARDFGKFPVATLYPINVFDKRLDGAYVSVDPGFNSVPYPCNAEPTLAPLPPTTGLYVDFLTATPTGGGPPRNLLYWDGLDDDLNGLDQNDVVWSAVPIDEIIRIEEVGAIATADGGTSEIAGIHVQNTTATGNIHDHIKFSVRRSGGGLASPGLYLLHLDLTMPGFAEGAPIFAIYETPGIAVDTKVAARNQVENQISQPLCNDGIDNDRDGLTDYAGGDPGCSDPTDSSEKAVGLACDDGIDNDLDGKIDFRAVNFGAAGLYATRDVQCGSPSDLSGEALAPAVPGLTPLGALALSILLAATGQRFNSRRA